MVKKRFISASDLCIPIQINKNYALLSFPPLTYCSAVNSLKLFELHYEVALIIITLVTFYYDIKKISMLFYLFYDIIST